MNDNRAFHQGGLGRDGVRNFEPQNEARNSRLDVHDSGVKSPMFDLRDSVFALGNSGHGSGNPVFACSDRGDNRRQDYSRDLNARVDRLKLAICKSFVLQFSFTPYLLFTQ